jgi:myo-inositol-1(or 4)-monophosphatase
LPATDLALLLEAAEASARIAARHWGKSPDVWEKPGLGPFTQADLEIDAMLRAELRAARPDYGWLSEETEDAPERLAAERVFIVDPIDGTRAFLARERSFAHALAVTERGRVIAGVVHLPMLDLTFAATEGGGATLNGEAIRPSGRRELPGARVLIGATQLKPDFWPGGVPAVKRHFRPSLAYRFCLAAQGRFDAAITLRDAWEWDCAAADLIAREAGATVTTREKTPARYNQPRPALPGLIVAGPALHAEILARI